MERVAEGRTVKIVAWQYQIIKEDHGKVLQNAIRVDFSEKG